MFNVGEKIVCVDNILLGYIQLDDLKIGQTYTIKRFSSDNEKQLFLKDEPQIVWNVDRFVSLKEYRKIKLNKLKDV